MTHFGPNKIQFRKKYYCGAIILSEILDACEIKNCPFVIFVRIQKRKSYDKWFTLYFKIHNECSLFFKNYSKSQTAFAMSTVLNQCFNLDGIYCQYVSLNQVISQSLFKTDAASLHIVDFQQKRKLLLTCVYLIVSGFSLFLPFQSLLLEHQSLSIVVSSAVDNGTVFDNYQEYFYLTILNIF